MKLFKYICVLVVTASILIACGGGDSGGDVTPNNNGNEGGNNGGDSNMGIIPTQVALVFPEDRTICNTGVFINDELSRVGFIWNEAENVDSYKIDLTNLTTGEVESFTTMETTLDIPILQGEVYAWTVTAINQSSETSSISERFQFYNSERGVQNYAPFPAELVSPESNSTVSSVDTLLEWIASDPDDTELGSSDIKEFEVRFGTDPNPTTVIGGTTNTSIQSPELVVGLTYYWKVITTDNFGNSTESGVFSFVVE